MSLLLSVLSGRLLSYYSVILCFRSINCSPQCCLSCTDGHIGVVVYEWKSWSTHSLMHGNILGSEQCRFAFSAADSPADNGSKSSPFTRPLFFDALKRKSAEPLLVIAFLLSMVGITCSVLHNRSLQLIVRSRLKLCDQFAELGRVLSATVVGKVVEKVDRREQGVSKLAFPLPQ